MTAVCTFIKKKNRARCSQNTLESSEFCQYHQPREQVQLTAKWCASCRTPVNAKVFARHVRSRCPVLQRQRALREEPFFVHSINSGPGDDAPLVKECAVANIDPVIDYLDAQIQALLTRVRKEVSLRLKDVFVDGSLEEQHLSSDSIGRRQEKHGSQHRGIIRRLKQHCKALVDGEAMLVEVGAGKAKLSHAITQVLPCDVLAIDMQTFHHSADPQLRERQPHFRYQRICINLQHLDLSRVAFMNPPRRGAAFVSKHLCGVGTDFALRMITSSSRRPRPSSSIFLATCCHHLCSHTHFAGRAMFESMGFTAHEFVLVSRMSSWATTMKNNTDMKADTIKLRKDAGSMCKLLLDLCRVDFLSRRGFTARLVKYVDDLVTPEHMLIEAIPAMPSPPQ